MTAPLDFGFLGRARRTPRRSVWLLRYKTPAGAWREWGRWPTRAQADAAHRSFLQTYAGQVRPWDVQVAPAFEGLGGLDGLGDLGAGEAARVWVVYAIAGDHADVWLFEDRDTMELRYSRIRSSGGPSRIGRSTRSISRVDATPDYFRRAFSVRTVKVHR